jgi:hypothetical protein
MLQVYRNTTWFNTKRAFLASALLLANQSIPIEDDFILDNHFLFDEANQVEIDSAITVASEDKS